MCPWAPCSCSWMLHVQAHGLGWACSRQFHPVGSGGEEGKGGAERELHPHFSAARWFQLLQHRLLTAVYLAKSEWLHTWAVSWNISLQASQLWVRSRAAGAPRALLTHVCRNKHIYTHMHVTNIFPHSGLSFLISKMRENSLCLSRGPSEFRDTAVNFATCNELGKTLLR